MKAEAATRHWSGHGEGGTLVTVVINRPLAGDCYNSTESDKAQAEADAAYVTDAIAAWDRQHGR